MIDQGLINHVAFVLDRSGSMHGKEKQLVTVTDGLIKHLARMSEQLGQETRVSVYFFDHVVDCVIFDKDVLRLPSIAAHYHLGGRTALIDATMRSVQDLGKTAVMYGDHSFLIYVLTDGRENSSQTSYLAMSATLAKLEENWTLACLVPDVIAKQYANNFGFPRGNIAIWDVSSATGMEEVGEEIRRSADAYMVGRAAGQTGTRTLFSTDAQAVNAATIAAAGLKPLDPKAYVLVPVTRPRRDRGQGVENKDKHLVWEISGFVKHATGNFTVGQVYYQLSKKERIQGNKALAVLENATSKVFTGDGVRAMIGLPDGDKSVAPDFNPEYTIFVQSTSVNRHLVVGTKVLVLK
jgi:hypothetical protein